MLNFLVTQGKIKSYYPPMRNLVKLAHYFLQWELDKAIDFRYVIPCMKL